MKIDLDTTARIESVFVGCAKPLARNGQLPVPSGIVKSAVPGRVRVGFTGLQGDEQGDPVYHGGAEKAVHHYPGEHYVAWRMRFPNSPVALAPGAFGENISTVGMSERDVHIGDIYQVGSALLQVSQGRQPCWKVNRHLNDDLAALAMQVSGATGWYYRVLKEGWIGAGDRLELVERPCADWPMQRLISALFPPGAVTPELIEEWRAASLIETLTINWRTTFERRVQSMQLEDWTRRLYEPEPASQPQPAA